MIPFPLRRSNTLYASTGNATGRRLVATLRTPAPGPRRTALPDAAGLCFPSSRCRTYLHT